MSIAGERASVAVVVPSWNGAAWLPACVTSLAQQSYPNLRVIVVDNGSTDESVPLLETLRTQLGLQIDIVRNPTNRGFAGGVNAGIRHALDQGVELIALLNNDAVAEPGWLTHLVDTLDRHPDAGIATGRLLLADGGTVDSTGDFLSVWGIAFPRDRNQPADPPRPSGYVFAGSGGASLYRASLFESVGLFDEAFFAYFEDVDLSFRAQIAGFRVVYCADAIAYHRQGTTSRRMPGFATRQMLQNLPLLLIKNLPRGLAPLVVPRFALLYPLLVANAVRRGEVRAAAGGVAAAVRLGLGHARRQRRQIQHSRLVDIAYLRSMIWPDLPPGMVLARAARQRMRHLLGGSRRPAGPADS